MHTLPHKNISQLRSFWNNYIIESKNGFLASGLEGKGRMEEPENIIEKLSDFFEKGCNKSLSSKKIMITAGPTYEKIDPVRFIGNYSSGKMGFALAEECVKRGADVTLITGPVSLKCSSCINRIDIENCGEMYKTLTALNHPMQLYCVLPLPIFVEESIATSKIKREKDDLIINLKPTRDIAATLGQMKQANQILVGFALETDNEENNAQNKLMRKNLDFIVLNSTKNPGTTFRSNDNQVTIISQNGKRIFEKKPKNEVAKDIIDELCERI